MEENKFRIQVTVTADLIYSKEMHFPNREAAEDYATHILENEIFEDWEFQTFEFGDSLCRIYEIS